MRSHVKMRTNKGGRIFAVPIALALLFAVVAGATEALPLSGRGHLSLLMAVENENVDDVVRAAAAIGASVALLIAARKRFIELIGEGVPLLFQPARLRASGPGRDLAGLLVANAVAIPGAFILSRAAVPLARAPLAQGIGMLATGIMLASTLAAPARARAHLATEQSLALGLSVALAALPGGSYTGAAFAALVWTGISKKRAVDLAFLAALPQSIAMLIGLLLKHGSATRIFERPGTLLFLTVASLVAGLAGAAIFRRVAERRMAEIAGFEVAIATAFVAYAWALTGSAA
jgi:undecaprenyl pyrophosphate phosphatase UppP